MWSPIYMYILYTLHDTLEFNQLESIVIGTFFKKRNTESSLKLNNIFLASSVAISITMQVLYAATIYSAAPPRALNDLSSPTPHAK